MALYLQLKEQLMKQIVDGTYSPGETLPTEHELCEQHKLSRVTVRKALEELKKEGLVTSAPRHGTVVARRKGGFSSSLDIIALVAEMHDDFFLLFMEPFERAAEKSGSLMLFKHDYKGEAFRSDELFFRLIQKNIRNIVMWPQTASIDFELLKRLHAVGMNFVFFDQMYETDVADCVCLDNRDAITSLYKEIRKEYAGDILYVDYEQLDLPSALAREQTFVELTGNQGRIVHIPWRKNIEKETAKLLNKLLDEQTLPGAIICNSGGIGLAAAQYLAERGISGIRVGTVDYKPDMLEYDMLSYEQPFTQMAEIAYQKLSAQNNQGSSWRAATYQIKGKLVFCGKLRKTADLDVEAVRRT